MKSFFAVARIRTGIIITILAVAALTTAPGNRDRAWAHDAAPPSTRPASTTRPEAEPTTRPLSPLAPDERPVRVILKTGHDTNRADHGRPVVLIAAALKVPDGVFRATFTQVHPAGPGSNGPTDAEARQNKAALMAGLSPYGVTDGRLNEVSNYTAT
jgi:hypothetical protein